MDPDTGARGEARGGFAESVQQGLAGSIGPAAVVLDDEDVLLLDFSSQHALLPPTARYSQDQIGQVLGEAFRFLSLRPLQADDPIIQSSQSLRLPLSAMLWQIALHAEPEHGGLLPLTMERKQLRLQRWPDFRVLARRYDDFRLCSLLLKRACTLQEAEQMLAIEPYTVRRLFNAACFSGLATVVETEIEATQLAAETSPPPSPASRPRGSGSLLAGMWRSMRARLRS